VQKVVVVAPPEPPKKKGLFRGKSAVSQAEYIKNAIELVKTYLPPDPAKIEACKSAGKVSYTPAGSTMRLGFHDYQKPGDVLGIQVDMAKNTLMSVGVDTWMKDAADKVALTSKFGSLKDGTMYIEERNLKAPSQSIEVKVTNSGYRKVQN
jgi:hypothetical protein